MTTGSHSPINKTKAINTNTIALVILFLGMMFLYWKSYSTKYNDELGLYLTEQEQLLLAKAQKLQKENDSLANVIIIRDQEIETIKTTKTKLKYVYINKTQEIDTFGIGSIISNYKYILSKGNIK